MKETTVQKLQRYSATAEAFRLWLKSNPRATRPEKYSAFDKIADSFAPMELQL